MASRLRASCAIVARTIPGMALPGADRFVIHARSAYSLSLRITRWMHEAEVILNHLLPHLASLCMAADDEQKRHRESA